MIELPNVHLKPCLHEDCQPSSGGEVLHVVAADELRVRVIGHLLATDDGRWSVAYQSENRAIWNGQTISLGTMPRLRDAAVLLMATANASDALHLFARTRPVDVDESSLRVQAWRL